MNIIKVEDYEEMSHYASQLVIEKMKSLSNPVLGLATGSTPERLYELLIQAYQQQRVTFANTTTFNLDEYVGLPPEHPNSYAHYMNQKLFNHVDIPRERVHIPNGVANDRQAECLHYEQMIKQENGIDLQILGIGGNGHIGFNEPGTAFSTKTHVLRLDELTREANARFFDSIDQVPTEAVTMGIDTIMQSKEIVLMISGEKKAEALAQLMNGNTTEQFPASILRQHHHVTIIADKEARSKVDRTYAYSKQGH